MKQTVLHAFRPYARVFILVLAAWASIGMAAELSARSRRVRDQPVIRVRIYNYAHVHRLDLRDAEGQAAYLLAKAGVRIAWTVYTQEQSAGRPQSEDSGTDFVVRIIPASMTARLNHKTGEAGQSLIPSGVHGPTPGGIAHVFYESVRGLALESGSFFGEVLGDVIAHELGHLLLGSGHSSAGIMKARWKLRDLRLASQGELRFSPGEVAALQRGARSLRQNPSLTVTAQR
jgi:hypothetical protein